VGRPEADPASEQIYVILKWETIARNCVQKKEQHCLLLQPSVQLEKARFRRLRGKGEFLTGYVARMTVTLQ